MRALISIILLSLLLLSCSVTKYVPEGERLLSGVKVVSLHDKSLASKAQLYIRQRPNSRLFSLLRLPLMTYSASGRDTAKWVNRFLRKIGEPPVIYDPDATMQTRDNLQQMLYNEGYLNATVTAVEKEHGKCSVDVIYNINENDRYYVADIVMETADTMLADIVRTDTAATLLSSGMPLNIDVLDAERRRITALLKDKGYYRFQKDYITFVVDTARQSKMVNVKMKIDMPRAGDSGLQYPHKRYIVNSLTFVTDKPGKNEAGEVQSYDSAKIGKYTVLYRGKPFMRPSVLAENNYITPGELYNHSNVNNTFNSLSQLSALRYSSIQMREFPDSSLLDCYIMLERSRRRSVTFEIEGTNTIGDLGAAASVTFSDRNLFRGSELLSLRLFGAYEAISGLSGYTRNSYYEYGAEVSLRLLGGVISPLLSSRNKMQQNSTLLSLKFNSQERPEFDRQILSGAWSHIWSKSVKSSHKLDLLDLNYIYVPWISETFKEEYLDSISNRNSILKYNYENLLITKLGYSYSYNSSYGKRNKRDRLEYALRTNIECSGNLLRGINALFGGSTNESGQYTFMNIAYAQYVKGDIDFTAYVNLDDRNMLVFHSGLGVAYPYGNSTILPFEKRYFTGGANSLRGWKVHGVGPGSYSSGDSRIDFINQSGDIKLDWSLEFRSYLFWKMYSAVFVDAGNIWTLRYYREQPGGQFDIKSFYKDLAFSYGMGLRFEFDLFVFRLDAGMKAVNPAYRGKERYPLLHPDFSRDFALHFAIGYPF